MDWDGALRQSMQDGDLSPSRQLFLLKEAFDAQTAEILEERATLAELLEQYHQRIETLEREAAPLLREVEHLRATNASLVSALAAFVAKGGHRRGASIPEAELQALISQGVAASP
eukprot:c26226_g1_i1.p2 GENE.c26226_g1_i1~~c26226_g1_i1.p2  ORF type:complete len:131 (-),score=31.62 c26226_g1_i1:455-799(-)